MKIDAIIGDEYVLVLGALGLVAFIVYLFVTQKEDRPLLPPTK